ncbi:poly(beta-D-mannuronate) lyase [Modicisalibacter ilicicola DSM 19980]|uniref:Poly(Beta-D-mannuronate) lyase n=2 Tax=Modicisalibacter ilicicola TaxID=480814 RepID=A0A1M4SAU0_9GAMM|nr:poly(beta-D-mannuronate) lyase [Halomonas ilicicola DSM 19980]
MLSQNGIGPIAQGGKAFFKGLTLVAFLAPIVSTTHAMTYEARQKLDLSEYTVKRPDASYFDVQERIDLLQETNNPMLMHQVTRLIKGPSCQQKMALPPLKDQIRIPGFYPSPEEWRFATRPLFQFEDTVSNLAGTYVASNDVYYAECLVSFLDQWAQADALMDFYYHWDEPQAWFGTESMIFAAAMAYSIVRPQVEGMDEEIARVNGWLNRLAHQHSSIPGGIQSSCCNNHFYRRALYATMVGVLTEDQELFRFGISAVYSALSDLTQESAFRLEMKRGRRATHYQNYALLYLITNMQIIARQGYDIFELEVDGKTIHDAIDFALEIIDDPAALGDLAPLEQYEGFLKDDQYFSWMEIYLSRFDKPQLSELIKPMRPVYNRSAGGYMSLYFMDPSEQRRKIIKEPERIEATRIFEE